MAGSRLAVINEYDALFRGNVTGRFAQVGSLQFAVRRWERVGCLRLAVRIALVEGVARSARCAVRSAQMGSAQMGKSWLFAVSC